MSPDFTWLLASGIAFSILVNGFMVWRFGWPNTCVFVIVAGLFPATMDFLSAFVVQNYEYPGQSRLWVFCYIFFGWMAVCGTCMLLAEGILAKPGEDMLTQALLWWQVPAMTGVIAVLLDLFLDPVAVAVGYWVWLVPAEVYFDIPLLNFVGWFVLMFLASLAWILITRQQKWGAWAKGLVAVAALIPLFIASVALSLALNGAITAAGLS